MYVYILCIDCYTLHCLSIVHAHDVSQGMGQSMAMTCLATTWVLLKAIGAGMAAFSKAHVLAMSWACLGTSIDSQHGHGKQ